MTILSDPGNSCCAVPKKRIQTRNVMIMPSISGEPQMEDKNDYRKPGYELCRFVEDFLETESGPVPRIKTIPDQRDRLSAVAVRIGLNRNRYAVSPGLYACGKPDQDSEVLVTANYKLTFDALRKELGQINAWILVLDTRGVNVWCAAGKKTFSSRELVHRIHVTGLDRVVRHKRLIVPQLGATGVSAGQVKKKSGFTVTYGPVRASDIPEFLKNNRKADERMRQVTFSFFERLVLTPVELRLTLKPALIAAITVLFLSGIGPGVFSLSNAGSRGMMGLWFLLAGIISGALLTPALLPVIPFRSFAAKGFLAGAFSAVLMILLLMPDVLKPVSLLAMTLFSMTVSSYLAMNFTGATPFTSPSGVEKEMKRFIPIQAVSILAAVSLWIYGAF